MPSRIPSLSLETAPLALSRPLDVSVGAPRSAVRGARALLRGGLVALALLTGATAAEAKPWVPGEIQSHLGMPCAPACTLCHRTAQGGGVVVTPFSSLIVGPGGFYPNLDTISPAEKASLDCALDILAGTRASCDSDPISADAGAGSGSVAASPAGEAGVKAIDDLRQGINPNDQSPIVCGPTYGCVRVAPRGRVDSAASVLGAFVAVLGIGALRRRRRR